ncbi:DUF4190 domain-containing protein [Plantactinospora sp. GCM10030261]|uniref:DUF4190 domain-containing protein n=1 Tax=Plantactinospora sp. GCM10030261 TaxID=3273420 RepID=UPI00360A4669
MTYPPPGEFDPDRPQPPYGQPASDPANPYGQYGQHAPPGYGPPGQHPAEAYGPGQPAHPGSGHPGAGQPWVAPGQPGQYGPGPRRTNVLAILALVFAFVFAPAGIVLGHLAKKQIRETGEEGEQVAQWGLVLSYVFTAVGFAACCAWIGVLFWAASSDGG